MAEKKKNMFGKYPFVLSCTQNKSDRQTRRQVVSDNCIDVNIRGDLISLPIARHRAYLFSDHVSIPIG